MIVIPMAGLSSRFFKAGYDLPKYQLMLNEETIFSWAVSSFRDYFSTDTFVFIYRDIFNTKKFIEKEIAQLGIQNFKLVCLDEETLGQADTVYQGIVDIEDEELFIFNIDSKLCHFTKSNFVGNCDGYLEVFKGQGDHWSFVDANSDNLVIRTTEKERISELCSNGLYYFKSTAQFKRLVEKAIAEKYFVKNELYVAPLYNLLIQEGATIRYQLVSQEDILFCGTPDEYRVLLSNRSGGIQ